MLLRCPNSSCGIENSWVLPAVQYFLSKMRLQQYKSCGVINKKRDFLDQFEGAVLIYNLRLAMIMARPHIIIHVLTGKSPHVIFKSNLP